MSKPDEFEQLIDPLIDEETGMVSPSDVVQLLRAYRRKVLRVVKQEDKKQWENCSHDLNAGHHLACANILAKLTLKKGTR